MIIANPIYDVVFKRLMENNRVAKFFVSTMLGQKVESLELQPQEFSYEDKLKFLGLRLFRLDFMAIVRTDEGTTKKILIEVQKAREEIDLMRFRSYLAEQYKKQEIIDDEEVTLPITTIYILGFKLPEVETACVHVARQYRDMINQSVLDRKNDFIECLTHDSYVVQVLRITGKYKTRLDKLLSVFEQKNFVGDTEIIKDYTYESDSEDEGLKAMTDILYHAGADPETREEIAKEREAWRTINEMIKAKEKKIKSNEKALEKRVEERTKELKEQTKKVEEQTKKVEEQTKELEAQRKLIEELKKRLKE